MKTLQSLLFLTFLFASTLAGAAEIKSIDIGNSEVVYDFETTPSNVAILTLNALVSETNNSLRGLKNSDRRRLSKLGQLIYQCKLMLYRSSGENAVDPDDLMLIAKNYSLYSGVNLTLDAGERVGIRVQALGQIDEASLFDASLGAPNSAAGFWQSTAPGEAGGMRQFDVNLLQESDLIERSESLDIVVRFPIFQLEKPVREWSYNFDLRDFKRAVRHIDEHCTPTHLAELIEQQ